MPHHQNFHGKKGEDRERWLTQVTHKVKGYRLSEEQALSFMISLLQGNAWDWYMGLGENEKRDVRSLTEALKEHFYEDSHDLGISMTVYLLLTTNPIRQCQLLSHSVILLNRKIGTKAPLCINKDKILMKTLWI